MSRTPFLSALVLAGLAAGANVQAADATGCIAWPDSATANGPQGQAGASAGPAGSTDPAPCRLASNSKGSKNARNSNGAKGSGRNGSINGQGNGQGDGQGVDSGTADSSDESKIQQGFAISPVPLSLEGRNRALVGLGSYIVNAQAGCSDCHTWPNFEAGGNPYSGGVKKINAANYLAGGRSFATPGGTFVSPNLTPDPASALTEEQRYADFVEIMRTGIDPVTSKYLQVMPWPVYQDMTDRDLKAIFEYLQAIPPAKPAG
jgi:hypothetical protein